MDDRGVGLLIVLARQRRQWRQVDLAHAAGVSQQLVALAEGGALDRLSVRAIRAIGAPLDIRLPFAPRWRGGEIDRLRDHDHVALVEQIVRSLRAVSWEVVVEYTYSHYGERGAIDVVGWHATLGVIVVVEVKTRIYDVQALLSSLDRKTRLAAQLLPAERGWRMRGVGRVVVVPETTANRSLVARHESVFHAALPDRSRRVRGWLRKPSGTLAGIWFLSVTNRVGDNHVAVGRQRVRLRRPCSGRGRDIA